MQIEQLELLVAEVMDALDGRVTAAAEAMTSSHCSAVRRCSRTASARAMAAVASRYVGGVYVDRAMAGQPGSAGADAATIDRILASIDRALAAVPEPGTFAAA